MSRLEVIPAIDLAGGRAVRLRRGERAASRVVADDPVELARRLVRQGAATLHLVDLDAAFGDGDNRETIGAILAGVEAAVQVGGGIRAVADAARWREAGAARVVVGTLAARAPDAVRRLVERDPDGVIVAADTRAGRIAVAGWTVDSGLELPRFLAEIRSWGVRRALVTAVERDGTGAGPDEDVLGTAVDAFGPGVIASGGVGSVEDVRRLARLVPRGLAAVVVGSLLVDGQATVGELSAAAGGG